MMTLSRYADVLCPDLAFRRPEEEWLRDLRYYDEVRTGPNAGAIYHVVAADGDMVWLRHAENASNHIVHVGRLWRA